MELVLTSTQEMTVYHDLDEQAKIYISKAKAFNTKKAYQSDWNDFEEWCSQYQLQSLPADPLTVVRYLTDRATNAWNKLVHKGKSRTKVLVTFNPLKPASIDRKLVSICKAHQFMGFNFDRKHPILTEMIAGLKREKGIKQNRKAPIMMEDLKQIVGQMENTLKSVRDRALLLLGFVGALRRSELVELHYEDLKFVKAGVELHLNRSKTDQLGEGHIIPIPYGGHLERCPVRALQDWLEISQINQGPLFRAINKHGQISSRGMCAAAIAQIVKSYTWEGKRDQYSGHSLRAGFCTQASVNGVSDTQGMKHSRHKHHDTWRKYVRLASIWQDNAATKLGL